MRAAAGQVADGPRRVRRRGVDHLLGPERRGPGRARPATTSTATTRAPAATATITADSPTPPQPCTATHSPGRTRPCCTTARYAVANRQPRRGGGRGREVVGQRDQVDVGVVEGDQLGERPPAGEPGLRLALAHLVVAAQAGRAACRRRTRTGPSRGRPAAHRVTSAPTAATVPASSWPGTCGSAMVRVVAHPAVPVAAAQPGGLDPHDDAVRRAAPGRAPRGPSADRRTRRRPARARRAGYPWAVRYAAARCRRCPGAGSRSRGRTGRRRRPRPCGPARARPARLRPAAGPTRRL